MNNEKIKSLIRHILTAAGALVTFIGLDALIPVISYLQGVLDQVWDTVIVLIGFITTVIGFFQDKGARFEEREKKE